MLLAPSSSILVLFVILVIYDKLFWLKNILYLSYSLIILLYYYVYKWGNVRYCKYFVLDAVFFLVNMGHTAIKQDKVSIWNKTARKFKKQNKSKISPYLFIINEVTRNQSWYHNWKKFFYKVVLCLIR